MKTDNESTDNSMIPYGHQTIGDEEIEAVVQVLKSNWLTQGPKISEFEEKLAAYCGAEHCVVVSNGTAALHLACLALGLNENDCVWTSPNSFVASANCARYCGADVDFVDIDPATRNMSVESLEEKITQAERLPSVIVPVHFAGQPCDMQAIKQIVEQYDIKIIEDAAHALGSSANGNKIGACRYSDMTTLSFHPVKTLTTGEGGAVLTNSPELANRLRELRVHGITKQAHDFDESIHDPWYYQQRALGFNYRMCDIQAALGIAQLLQLPHFIDERRRLVRAYNEKLATLPVKIMAEAPEHICAWHLYVIELEHVEKRRQVYDYLVSHGIGVNVHYIPIHWQPYYRQRGFKKGDFPNSERYYAGALTLPLFPGLSEAQQNTIVEKLGEALS